MYAQWVQLHLRNLLHLSDCCVHSQFYWCLFVLSPVVSSFAVSIRYGNDYLQNTATTTTLLPVELYIPANQLQKSAQSKIWTSCIVLESFVVQQLTTLSEANKSTFSTWWSSFRPLLNMVRTKGILSCSNELLPRLQLRNHLKILHI